MAHEYDTNDAVGIMPIFELAGMFKKGNYFEVYDRYK